MFLDRKNQYDENDYTTKCRFLCDPYQNTNGIFHRTRTKNFTVHMETQNTLNSQSRTLPTKVHLVKAMVFPVVMCGCESWIMSTEELMLLNCGDGEDSSESLGLKGVQTSQS